MQESEVSDAGMSCQICNKPNTGHSGSDLLQANRRRDRAGVADPAHSYAQ